MKHTHLTDAHPHSLDGPAARTGALCVARPCGWHQGITIVEAMLVVTILIVFVTIAVNTYEGYRDRVRTARAVGDIASISVSIREHWKATGRFPADLAAIGKSAIRDPWGNPYLYVGHDDRKSDGRIRTDKNGTPINGDFDLWSIGKDGDTRLSVTDPASRDDIVRANGGAFIGLASDYDP